MWNRAKYVIWFVIGLNHNTLWWYTYGVIVSVKSILCIRFVVWLLGRAMLRYPLFFCKPSKMFSSYTCCSNPSFLTVLEQQQFKLCHPYLQPPGQSQAAGGKWKNDILFLKRIIGGKCVTVHTTHLFCSIYYRPEALSMHAPPTYYQNVGVGDDLNLVWLRNKWS